MPALSKRQQFILDCLRVEQDSLTRVMSLNAIHTAINNHFAINASKNAVKITLKRLIKRNLVFSTGHNYMLY